jgi:serine protease AprX
MPAARRVLPIIVASLFSISLIPAQSLAAAHLGPQVRSYLSAPTEPGVKVWIYFRDHGQTDQAGVDRLLGQVTINPRALERRLRRSRFNGPDRHDLPVPTAYVDAIRALGGEVRHASRYLDAVSAWVDPEQLRAIGALPYVRRIDRVARGVRPVPPPSSVGRNAAPDGLRASAREGQAGAAVDGIDYGWSYLQQRMTDTPPLHAEGYHGEGIRIAMLDTGFFVRHSNFYYGHEAFDSLDVIAQRDFINDDDVTADQPGDGPGQMFHGTGTLGLIAANWPGRVMGIAWAAEYLLAKTERVAEEIQVEEDDYVAALEWADALGVDVVSSSLGYYEWYDYEDMDGNTAVTTRAVDIAASRGILVVTAMGNEGPFPWPTILAPADADSAIAVGAADTAGVVTDWSSRGPTYDGRIKPDVIAEGQITVTVDWRDPNQIAVFSGTSAATPLVAGACALILQKHPDWSPIQVRAALRATASHADDPDNDHGWGLVDASAASDYVAAIPVAIDVLPGSCENPFNPKRRGILPTLVLGAAQLSVRAVDVASLRLGGAAAVRSAIVDAAAAGGDVECARSSPDGFEDLWVAFDAADVGASIGPAEAGEAAPLALTGRLSDGTPIEGRALVRVVGAGRRASRAEGSPGEPRRTGLGPATPNPFNPVTTIPYSLVAEAHVDLAVYDVRGRRIATLVDANRPAGEHAATWDASQEASGVYFYQLRAGGVSETRKILLLK